MALRLPQPPDNFKSGHSRKQNVQDDDVGPVLVNLPNRVEPVARRRYDPEFPRAGVAAQHVDEDAAHQRAVVGDDDRGLVRLR